MFEDEKLKKYVELKKTKQGKGKGKCKGEEKSRK
jgi:hypothetical protein